MIRAVGRGGGMEIVMRNAKKRNGWIRKGLLISIISALTLSLAACGTSLSGQQEETADTQTQGVTESDDSVEMTGEDIVGVVGGESDSTEEGTSEAQTGDGDDADASADREETDGASDGEKVDESITMIGDSVMLGAKPALEERFVNGYVDATESRQVWDADDIVSELEQSGNLASTVVIALGTNGSFNSETGQALIDQIGSDREIYWVTAYGATLEWQDDTNAAIENVAANNENVHIIDWAAAAEGQSGWFYNDGIHLNEDGQEAFAQVVLQGIAGE